MLRCRRDRASTRASCAWSWVRPASAKSTLLGAINGLVPHFSGGTLAGDVSGGRTAVCFAGLYLPARFGRPGGRRRAKESWVRRARHRHGRRGARVRHGRSWPCRAPVSAQARVEETLDLLGAWREPSSPRVGRAVPVGQQQRVAIGAVLTAHPPGPRAGRAHVGARPDSGQRRCSPRSPALVHDLGVDGRDRRASPERVVRYADRRRPRSATGSYG